MHLGFVPTGLYETWRRITVGGGNNGNQLEQIPTAGSQHSADYSWF
jgi:hypothetical protein